MEPLMSCALAAEIPANIVANAVHQEARVGTLNMGFMVSGVSNLGEKRSLRSSSPSCREESIQSPDLHAIDPDVTFADASWGSGSINIIPNLGGNAVFQIVTDGVGAAGQGGVFVRVRTEVPEPSSSLLVLLGCAGLVARRRRA